MQLLPLSQQWRCPALSPIKIIIATRHPLRLIRRSEWARSAGSAASCRLSPTCGRGNKRTASVRSVGGTSQRQRDECCVRKCLAVRARVHEPAARDGEPDEKVGQPDKRGRQGLDRRASNRHSGRHGLDRRVCVIGRHGRRLRLIGAANRDKEAEQVGRDADAKVHEGAGEDGGHEARGVMSSRSMRAPMSSDPLFFTLFRGHTGEARRSVRSKPRPRSEGRERSHCSTVATRPAANSPPCHKAACSSTISSPPSRRLA